MKDMLALNFLRADNIESRILRSNFSKTPAKVCKRGIWSRQHHGTRLSWASISNSVGQTFWALGTPEKFFLGTPWSKNPTNLNICWKFTRHIWDLNMWHAWVTRRFFAQKWYKMLLTCSQKVLVPEENLKLEAIRHSHLNQHITVN